MESRVDSGVSMGAAGGVKQQEEMQPSVTSSSGDTADIDELLSQCGSAQEGEAPLVFDEEDVQKHVTLKRSCNTSDSGAGSAYGSGGHEAVGQGTPPPTSPPVDSAASSPFGPLPEFGSQESGAGPAQTDQPSPEGQPPIPGVTAARVEYYSREDFENSAKESCKGQVTVETTLKALKPQTSTKQLARMKKRNWEDKLKVYAHMENMLQLLDFNATALADERSTKVFKVVSRLALSMLVPYECIILGHRLWLRETALASPFSDLELTELESRGIFFVAIDLVHDWYKEKGGEQNKMARGKMKRIIAQHYSEGKVEALRQHMECRLGWKPIMEPAEGFMLELAQRLCLPSVVERNLLLKAIDTLTTIRASHLALLVVPSLQVFLSFVQAAKDMRSTIDNMPLTEIVIAAATQLLEVPACCHILQGFAKDGLPLLEYLVKNVNTSIFRTSAFLAWRPSPWMGFDPSLPPLDLLVEHAVDEPRLDSAICRVVYYSKRTSAPVPSNCFITRISFGPGLPPVYFLDADKADHASPEYTSSTYAVKIVDFEPPKPISSLYKVGLNEMKILISVDKCADPQVRKKYMSPIKKQLQLNLLKDNYEAPTSGNVEVVRVMNESHGNVDLVRLLLRIHPISSHTGVDGEQRAHGLELCIGSAIALDLLAIERDTAMSESFDRVLDVIADRHREMEEEQKRREEEEDLKESEEKRLKEEEEEQKKRKENPGGDQLSDVELQHDCKKATVVVPDAKQPAEDEDKPRSHQATSEKFMAPHWKEAAMGASERADSVEKLSAARPLVTAATAPAKAKVVRRNTVSQFLLSLHHPPDTAHNTGQRSAKHRAPVKPALPRRTVYIFDEKKKPEPKCSTPKKTEACGDELPQADFLKRQTEQNWQLVPLASKEGKKRQAEGVTLTRVQAARVKLYRTYTDYKDLRFDKPTREQYLQTTETLTMALHLLKDMEESLTVA